MTPLFYYYQLSIKAKSEPSEKGKKIIQEGSVEYFRKRGSERTTSIEGRSENVS